MFISRYYFSDRGIGIVPIFVSARILPVIGRLQATFEQLYLSRPFIIRLYLISCKRLKILRTCWSFISLLVCTRCTRSPTSPPPSFGFSIIFLLLLTRLSTQIGIEMVPFLGTIYTGINVVRMFQHS